MKLFSGSANKPLATKIAEACGIQLGSTDVYVFPDGERRIRIGETVIGEHVFVVQAASTPVDTNYMELFFLIDALKRSGAEFVTAIIPYFGYQRQDHIFRDGEAVSLEVIIKMIQTLGADRVISLDMHSMRIPDLFTIPVSHLSALALFAEEIKNQGWNTHDGVLVSPDMGGIARIKKLAEFLDDMSYVSVEKNRDLATGSLTSSGIHGDIQGKKRAFLVDDMIASGKTTVLAAQALQQKGIEEIYAFATHAIFAEEAPELLQNSLIKKVFVTDTVFVPQEKQFAKLTVLSVAKEIAKEIQSVLSI